MIEIVFEWMAILYFSLLSILPITPEQNLYLTANPHFNWKNSIKSSQVDGEKINCTTFPLQQGDCGTVIGSTFYGRLIKIYYEIEIVKGSAQIGFDIFPQNTIKLSDRKAVGKYCDSLFAQVPHGPPDHWNEHQKMRWKPIFIIRLAPNSEVSVKNIRIVTYGEPPKIAIGTIITVLFHFGFWSILLLIYPKFTMIQAIFFYNKWIRRFMGLFYVDLFLSHIPFIRRRLLLPFKETLVADADIDRLSEQFYYKDIEVFDEESGKEYNIFEYFSKFGGQVLIVGNSGAGKSLFLRYYTKNEHSNLVFLPAHKCSKGVINAITEKLYPLIGFEQGLDKSFIEKLIFLGAMNVVIDGLNEVNPDTRAEIRKFAEKFQKSNLILSTQPITWKPPTSCRSVTVKPFDEQQTSSFLQALYYLKENHNCISYSRYLKLVGKFVERNFDHTLQQALPPFQIFANPMDLTTISRIALVNKVPDLLRIQEQEFNIMKEDYEKKYTRSFPICAIAEYFYKTKIENRFEFACGDFFDEFQMMYFHKMLLCRDVSSGNKQDTIWRFRHDKIADYFVLHAFWGKMNDRAKEHINDSRFRGVYLLMVFLLPIDEALQLNEILIHDAAQRRDHTLSDDFYNLLNARKTLEYRQAIKH